jgi:hypothetical protein
MLKRNPGICRPPQLPEMNRNFRRVTLQASRELQAAPESDRQALLDFA